MDHDFDMTLLDWGVGTRTCAGKVYNRADALNAWPLTAEHKDV